MAGFDNFKTFVHHSSGVNSDLGAHLPSRMPQSLSRCYSSQLFFTAVAERAAGSSQENPFELTAGSRAEALPDSRVLAIYRQDFGLPAAGQLHDNLPARNQCLFIGQGNILTRFQRSKNRSETSKADHRCQDKIGLGQGGSCLQSAVVGQNLRLIGSFQIEFGTQNISKLLGSPAVADAHQAGAKL